MNPNAPYSDLLKQQLDPHPFLIVAHRGLARANIIENTVASMQACFLAGADVVEADVIRSTDGQFYMIHDDEEARLFGNDVPNVRTLSSAQIDVLEYKNQLNEASGARVERFEDFIQALPNDRLLNLDRGWFDLPELLVYLDQFDIAERLLLKTNAKENELKTVAAHPKKYLYFAICRSADEVNLAIAAHAQGVNLVGLELIANHNQHEFLQPNYIHQLKEKGYLVMVNTLNIEAGFILWGQYDDDTSVTAGPQYGWGGSIKTGSGYDEYRLACLNGELSTHFNLTMLMINQFGYRFL